MLKTGTLSPNAQAVIETTPYEKWAMQRLGLDFANRRVAHLCIHNQNGFIVNDTVLNTADRDTMTTFCQGLADYTTALAPYVMTVNAQLDVNELNERWTHISKTKPGAPEFHGYWPERKAGYDAAAFRINTGDIAHNPQIIDLARDPGTDEYVLIGVEEDIFDGETGTRLMKHLRENQIDSVLITGLYSTACTVKSARHAAQFGFQTYALTDQIFTHPWAAREYGGHHNIMQWWPQNVHRIDADTTMRLAMAA